MTEADWDRCTDPAAMLDALRAAGKLTDRRARLFACGCVRRIWGLLDERGRRAVEVAERFADGAATEAELSAAAINLRRALDEAARSAASFAAPYQAAEATAWLGAEAAAHYAAFAIAATADAGAGAVRGRFPRLAAARDAERRVQCRLCRCVFGSAATGPPPPLAPALLTWNDGTAVKLARAIYEARRFEDVPILADALEEAGSTDAGLLGHLRSGGPHVRGCYAVDAVLGRA